MTDERSYTLPVLLNSRVDQFSADWGLFAAGALVTSLPVMALFYVLQRMGRWAGPTHGAVEYVRDTTSPLWHRRMLPHLRRRDKARASPTLIARNRTCRDRCCAALFLSTPSRRRGCCAGSRYTIGSCTRGDH